jgi:hypothetical protein
VQTKNSGVPLWFRFLSVFFFFGSSGAWILARIRPPREYIGLAYESIVSMLFIVVLATGAIAVVFVFFHQRFLARVIYWLFFRGRWYLGLFVFYGLLEYYLRLPLLYVEQYELIFNRASFAGIRGLGPLAISAMFFAVLFFLSSIENPFSLQFQSRVLQKKQTLAKILLLNSKWSALIPGSLPVIIVLLVIYGLWGAKLSDYLPVFWNDATGYWLWMRQFSTSGLGGGYNYPNELMPPAAFNHFGEGSPLYTYFYGVFGYLLGWVPHLPILVNFGLIIASVYIFSRLTCLDTAQNLVLALVMSVSWPVMIFAATTSHETLNQAMAIGFAGIFIYLRQDKTVSLVSKILIVLFVFFAGMLRLSWVILFLPLFYYLFSGSIIRRILVSVLMSGGLALGIIWLTGLLVPPINNSIFATLGSEAGLLVGLQNQFIAQIKKLIIWQRFVPGLAIIFILLILLIYSLRESVLLIRQKPALETFLKSQAFFDIYNVLALLLAGMTLYLANGFYRVFFAPLLVSVFMLVVQRKYRFVWSLVLFSLLFAPVTLTGQGDWDGAKMNYTYRMTELTDSQESLNKLVTYDEDTDNPWCNTIMIPLSFYDVRLTGLHPGIGVSYLLSYDNQKSPLQSKYLLLDDENYSILTEHYHLQAEPLASLPIGNLYRNLDAICTP